MATFATVYDEKIRPLMDRIDQARVLLAPNNYGITFPNVIVVGDQSSGKSSLLESLSLVGLPKGNGIVTRCPLVLRLRKSNERRVYRVYDDNHDNKKVLLDEANLIIPRYIEEETKKLAGDHKNIVKDMIELQVEDPSVRDLTVVDLPGIAHNPIADQPEDIYDQTINLIRQFIDQKGSVILCVFPANVDIATVQSFKLAREADPSGKRTIGVITKSDLASDQDMLVQQLLMDRPDVLHLKLGFVAVRNRNTKENISLKEAHEKEKEFFEQHPASTAAGWNCIGINALINRLTTVYSERVKETFPKLRNDIQARLKEVTEQLSKLPPHLQTTTERVAVYNEIVDLYIEKILKPPLMGSNEVPHGTMELIELDRNEPYTNNTAYMYIFEKYKGSILDKNATVKKSPAPSVTNAVDYSDDEDDVLTYKQSSSDAQAVKQMLLSIYSYWKFLTKRFIDYTTLSLRAGCVFTICSVIQQRLRRIPIEHSDLVERYLSDDDFIRNKRKQCQKTKDILEKVYKILHEDDTMTADEIYSDFTEIESDSTATLQAVSQKSSNVATKNTPNSCPSMSTTMSPLSPQVNQSTLQSSQNKPFSFTAPAAQTTFNFAPSPVTTASPFIFRAKPLA
ncbi:unnamed protein product [Rotaria sordida]|uniref:Dynamin-type G domain-containing protein n=1 Tax=Rotaria sordida TaxID=392033 RepID=A0A814STN5_9BILA|nr:unnamed protein product [Rotaria sordida]CAF1189346.1 unnamed protein product [Rotaria sordida]CAF3942119.1 unnamed protein product [Rotaria sordida]